jgi:hypothetical protein
MSGPVEDQNGEVAERGFTTIEVREGRTAEIGRLKVSRILPTKRRRTIGPWCFLDMMHPDDVAEPPPLEIGPHPHIGLSTATWLLTGSALHSDSLGTEQLIRPGQLNLMTAGHGIAHAELGVETSSVVEGTDTMGIQMWLAQPEQTRNGDNGFQHLPELPRLDFGNSTATVLIGGIAGTTSPALTDHPTLGLDVVVRESVELPLQTHFEHGVVPIDRPMLVEDVIVEPGALAIVPVGRMSLRIAVRGGEGRFMLLGGEPLGEQVQMWWNFVARSRDELTDAWIDWRDGNEDRFGPVPSSLERIEAPVPPWVRDTTAGG